MTQPQEPRHVPAWVFILVILFCLGGGTAFVVWYLQSPNPLSEQIVQKTPEQLQSDRVEPQGNRGTRRERPTRRRSNIELVNREGDVWNYRVRGNGILMQVSDHRSDQDQFRFTYRRRDVLPDAQQNLARLRWRVLQDRRTARYLRINDAQLERLRAMEITGDLVVAEEHLSRMRSLWEEANVRRGGANPEQERQIMELLQVIADQSEELTRERLGRQISAVSSILTAEQIAAFEQMGQPDAERPPAPATQPAN